ncbi:DUF4190 domain-containing protein [Arthrobacter sp. H35-D1]|uniref:DUF4190 domain-containing protein n=1 Tax=Arthrobacter sp. H35-D1 TaxID=3046202 RepID=UPI0024BA9519|nr:DUF4190 domain-containing protein [Arthrobacter sp. H35-D1]MDJ0315120.1 DUF4190 domain-containing protein [Arthrobacter sp. H35-D1]
MTQNPENPYEQPKQNPENTYGQPAQYQGQQPQGYAQPGYGMQAEDPGKTLGIIGLVLCFVFSLAGLIVSIIAKKKSAAAGFTDNTPANVGVILGWIFTILGFLAFVFYIIFIIVIINSGEMTSTY